MQPTRFIPISIVSLALSLILAGCATAETPVPTQAAKPAAGNSATSTARPQAAAPTDTPRPALPTSHPLIPTATATITPTPLPDVVEIPEVPTYPDIIHSTRVHALAWPVKCGSPTSLTFEGYQFVKYDVYYSVDYGQPDMPKADKLTSPKNQEIAAFFRDEFEEDGWHTDIETDSPDAAIKLIAWEDEERAATPGPGQDDYEGACYLVTILIQPPGADLRIVALVEKNEGEE